ncbi:MAG: hypothetical protein IPL79_01615 [Myxococcales bacterium]|nr:hypothetical protein [Myxococcales bacterium]
MTRNPLPHVYGELLVTRPPVPVTCNKAGANYKSEVPHLRYSPREAYREWLAICDGIVACGGDALFAFEPADDPFLDIPALHVNGDGEISPQGSSEILGNLAAIETGRVFTANGPWVTIADRQLRAVMPHMLAHRRSERPYYEAMLGAIAAAGRYELTLVQTPYRWEGMADVAVVGEHVVLTYAVPGHYDEGLQAKSPRSSLEGVTFAADAAGVPTSARIYAELVYPHFHGDTVHFGVRPRAGAPKLAHYGGGLYRGYSDIVALALGNAIIPISQQDAQIAYAANSRQVRNGLLTPRGASDEFIAAMRDEAGLALIEVALHELFGKAGGGPACATLYLPANLALPEAFAMRYRKQRGTAHARIDRLAETLTVDPDYFAGKKRG